MQTDKVLQFKPPTCAALTNSADAVMILSGVESHNAMGIGERHHYLLSGIYQRAHAELLRPNSGVGLPMAVSSMNSAAKPNALVVTPLDFGVIQGVPMVLLALPAQR